MAESPYQISAILSVGQANASFATWNSSTAQNTVALAVNNDYSFNTLVITLNQTTTITGGVVTFEGSIDGVTFFPMQGFAPGTFAPIGPTYTLQANTYATFSFNLTGVPYFQVRLSTVIAGTGVVTVGYAADSFVSGVGTAVSGTVAATQSGTWTVQQGGAPWSVTISGQPISVSQSGTWNIGTLTSITNALPAGTNVIGHVITDSGSTTVVTGTVAVTQSTSPWVVNMTQVAGTTLGTPQTFGTAPTGIVIGTSSDIYVAGTRARSNQTTTAAGVVDVNIVGSLGATNSATNGTFIAITDNTTKVGVIAGTTALKTDMSSVAGTATSTAAAGVQKVGVVGNSGSVFDGAITAATAPANGIAVLGVYNSTVPSLTTGQSAAQQLDSSASHYVSVRDRTVAISISTATGTSQIALEGRQSVAFTITSVGTGGTMVVEVSVDGANWIGCDVWSELNETWIINPATISFTGTWWLEPLGAIQFARVRATALTSGTITGTWLAGNQPMGTFEYQAGDATTFPNNVVAIGGKGQSDGLMHGLLVDNTGKLQVAATSGASDTVGTTTALNALNAAATVAMTGENTCGFMISAGTLIGTITPELSMDGGTTWTGTYFFDPTTLSFSPNIVFSAANGTLQRSILVSGGVSNVRVRVSAFTSGTANATLRSAVGAAGAFFVSSLDGEKATYRAISALFYALPATPTDTFIMSGSSTRTIRVNKIFVQTIANSNAGLINMQVIRRSAANTGGTAVAITPSKADINDANSTIATCQSYTANPTALGAQVAVIDQQKLLLPTSPNAFLNPQELDFGQLPGAKSLVLRGTSDFLAINLVGSSLPTGGASISTIVQFTEE
jgi:hypothetical protein